MILELDLVRLRSEPTTVGVVSAVYGNAVGVEWLFKPGEVPVSQVDVEVVGRYDGAQ